MYHSRNSKVMFNNVFYVAVKIVWNSFYNFVWISMIKV